MVAKHKNKEISVVETEKALSIEELMPVENYNGQQLEVGKVYVSDGKAYKYINSRVGEAVVEMKELKPTYDKLEEKLLSVKIKQVPFRVINKVHSFLKRIYEKTKTEVAVILWYNDNLDDWKVEVPKQVCSGAHVDYERSQEEAEEFISEGYFEAGTIHSHANMSAFHSATDDADEIKFDGLHMTMGNFDLSEQTFSQRLILGQMILKLEFYQMVSMNNIISKFHDVEIPEEWINNVEVKKIDFIVKSNIKGFNRGYNKYSNKGTLITPQNVRTIQDNLDEQKINRIIKKTKGMTKQERKAYRENVDYDKNKVICPICYNDNEIGDLKCKLCETPLYWGDEEVSTYYNTDVNGYRKPLEEAIDEDKIINREYIY